jgi:hypothetical protein
MFEDEMDKWVPEPSFCACHAIVKRFDTKVVMSTVKDARAALAWLEAPRDGTAWRGVSPVPRNSPLLVCDKLLKMYTSNASFQSAEGLIIFEKISSA